MNNLLSMRLSLIDNHRFKHSLLSSKTDVKKYFYLCASAQTNFFQSGKLNKPEQLSESEAFIQTWIQVWTLEISENSGGILPRSLVQFL